MNQSDSLHGLERTLPLPLPLPPTVATMPKAGDTSVNVRVAVRCRPMSSSEAARGCSTVVSMDGASTAVTRPPAPAHAPHAGGPKTFTFDHSYGPDVEQERVYRELALPILDASLEGFNGTIFAYGQTGSGKTHTMMGTDDDPGIVPLLQRDLFRRVGETQAEERAEESERPTQFLVTVSYLEIYNEVIKDLLNPSDKQLKLRESTETGVFVENLAELVVADAAAVASLVEQGNKVRRVAATQMNERSSRSHSVFTLRVEQKTEENVGSVRRQRMLTSKINLVDLAGSERASKTGATGERLREGAAINKSLSALANVINALAEGKGHTPYRDSKLTRLLQHSLGGNSLTVMVATVSPADYNMDETLSTLHYAARAKTIKNATHINETVTEKLIRELRQTIDELRAQLAAATAAGGGAAGGAGSSSGDASDSAAGAAAVPDEVREMQARIAALEAEQRNSWEEKQRLSGMFEEERKKNMASEQRIRSVMTTMKEENMELLRRVRALQAEKVDLSRRYKKQKEQYLKTRKSLEADSAAFEEIVREKGADAAELAPLLEAVNDKKATLIKVREDMAATKQALAANEEKQTEERAAAAAQRVLLEEDAELRKAIQEDERAKMEAERAVFLEAALAEERERLVEQTKREKEALLERFRSAGLDEKAQGLELALLQANADREMLRLELDEQRRRADEELARRTREHRRATRAAKLQELKVLREVCEGFETERAAMEAKYRETAACLRQAVKDIVHLTKRNAELEQQIRDEASWEPAPR